MSFYRILLHLFPPAFQRRYGADMENCLADRLGEPENSPIGRGWIWIRAVMDVLRHAPAERWLALDVPRKEPRAPQGWLYDLRHGFRSLRRSPGFATVAILTLALGIGANAAVFSVVRAVLLQPLPYSQADRLVTVWPERTFNKTMLQRVLDGVPAFEDLSGVSVWTLTLTGGGEPQELEAALVTPNHFEVLGVAPFLGRAFSSEEGAPGGGDVALLSHHLWQSRFGGDSEVVGRRISLSGADHDRRTVVGVMPPSHRPLVRDVDVWVPLEVTPGQAIATDTTFFVFEKVARLAPGASEEQAQDQLRAVALEIQEEAPRIFDDEAVGSASGGSLLEYTVGEVKPTLWILFSAVALLLLIACTNVANLLLVRAEARQGDLAVRRALGASGGRLLRQQLTDAALLGLLGGAVGFVIARLAVAGMVALAPEELPRTEEIVVNGSVLAFSFSVALLAALLFGVLPVMRSRRLGSVRGAGGRIQTGRNRTGSLLVVVEVAVAVVLVIASGLMVRTLAGLSSVDPGFHSEGVLAFRANPPTARYGDAAAFEGFYSAVLEQLREVPGIASAGGIQLLPLTKGNWNFPTYPQGLEVGQGAPPPSINFRVVTPGYLETLEIPLHRGRLLRETDRIDAPSVVLVNQALARRYWPGEDPLGKEIRLFEADGDPRTVVGVVGDLHQRRLDAEPQPEMYFSYAQQEWPVPLWLVAKVQQGRSLEEGIAAMDPALLATTVRSAIWRVDPDVPVSGLEPMDEIVGRSAASTRFVTSLLAAFGLLAVLLGTIGVYGVTAYAVSRRKPEIAVRMALGATRGAVLRSAFLRAMVPVAAGLVVGTAGAGVVTRFLESLLFGIGARDPLTFVGVLALLVTAAAGAVLLPTLRASSLDPMRTLRGE